MQKEIPQARNLICYSRKKWSRWFIVIQIYCSANTNKSFYTNSCSMCWTGYCSHKCTFWRKCSWSWWWSHCYTYFSNLFFFLAANNETEQLAYDTGKTIFTWIFRIFAFLFILAMTISIAFSMYCFMYWIIIPTKEYSSLPIRFSYDNTPTML